MIGALAAEGPLPEYADKLMLFGRLIGSWDCTGRFLNEDGSVREEHFGEWHFGWALEGRAVQDVLISPPRDRRPESEASFEYGTTIRIYVPAIDRQKVTFISSMTGNVVNLVARENAGEIWLEGAAVDGRLFRWTFSKITDSSVHWQGFTSRDEGETWLLEEEILLTRRR